MAEQNFSIHDVILVEEDEIAAAIRHIYEVEGEVVEGAGAVGVAALLRGKLGADRPTVALLSGGNIAPELHRAIVTGRWGRQGGGVMPAMRVLTEADLRRCVALDAEAVQCGERAFVALATQNVAMPPILRLDIPEHRGEVDVKTAYVPGVASFALKVSPGFFDNPGIGLPSLNGLMILFSARTGLVEALLLDNGYLTDVRTAAAGAVAARHLAREDAHSAAIFGAGAQARLQLEALTLVRPLDRAVIWARDLAKAQSAATELSNRLGFPVVADADPERACRTVDIVVATTPAETPILRAEWVRPGQHVTAMGSDSEHKNEIDPKLFARAVYVADSLKQTRRLGELRSAIAAGLARDDECFPELGQVIAGRAAGRRARNDITLCDLTGTGVQDTAIATLAFAKALAEGAGQNFLS